MTAKEFLQAVWAACHVVKVERSFVLPAAKDVVWDAVCDTNRLNRLAGLDRIQTRPISDGTAARYRVRTHLGGFAVVYDEEPYEWEHLNMFRVTRKVVAGSPTRLIQMQYVLQSVPQGTLLRLRCVLLPRLAILAPVMWLITQRQLKKLQSACETLLSRRGQPPRRRVRLGDGCEESWSALRKRSFAAHRLQELLECAADEDVTAMRPYALARAWQMQRDEALALFLHAKAQMLLEMRAGLLCPSCRLSVGDPRWVHSCHVCDIQLGSGKLIERCELLFSPASSVRKVDEATFCPGGPSRLPHVLDQIVVPHGGIAELSVPEAAQGHHRLFERGGSYQPLLLSFEAPEYVHLAAGELQPKTRLSVRPGGKICLRNLHAYSCHVKLERVLGDVDDAALVANVMTLVRQKPQLFSATAKLVEQVRDDLQRLA